MDGLREKPLLKSSFISRSSVHIKSIAKFFTASRIVGLTLVALVIFSYQLTAHTSILSKLPSRLPSLLRPPPTIESNPVYNATLGFEYIYGIVLPGRTDRKETLANAANATNLTITFVDGVFDKDVPDNQYPKGWKDEKKHWRGQLGCLKSHTNLWEKMIAQNISNALILESDADWDMRIKPSVHGFSEGVRKLLDFRPPSESPIHEIGETSSKEQYQHPRDFAKEDYRQKEPYGDNWDLLYLGNCNSKVIDHNTRMYAYNDPGAAPRSHAKDNGPDPKVFPRNGTTRFVFQPIRAGCTVAYAITNRGAQKMMTKWFTPESKIYAVDMTMQSAMTDPNLSFVTAFPPIIAQAPSASNMMGGAGKSVKEKVEPAPGIQISARVNADLGLARKGPEKWKKEWGDDKR